MEVSTVTFADSGRVITKIGNAQHYIYGIAIDSYGKIIMCGNATLGFPDNFILLRYTSGLLVGINPTILKEDQLILFPNPAMSMITISNNLPLTEILITDIRGKRVYQESPESMYSEINMQDFVDGFYIIHIVSGTGVYTRKFSVVH